ncbi:uncharacterized protein BCR38DRAFT_343638, partial [Pseudomassariella vexata]
ECRNVLVRYCAHIPRNYQYKDGVQQIFLILREHLGDENLDLAGGVLYEMIEIDCEHTDDPGAAFQRWRHDHMSRYNDFELPHVPHMTTITSSIIPTSRLTLWRAEHPERYTFVLSDSSVSGDRLSADRSCIRNRKAWLIDNTFYVSSRNGGTLPLNTPNPKEFHEMQWRTQCSNMGRLVDEREISVSSSTRHSESTIQDTSDSKGTSNPDGKPRGSLSRYSLLGKLVEKLGKQKKEEPCPKQRRRSWIPSALLVDSGSGLKDLRTGSGEIPVPLPDGQVPNAIFARKYLLVEEGESLPPYLPISQMPTADLKATDMLVEAANSGFLEKESTWHFRGPFTPQLGYDGGLDYQWASRGHADEPATNHARHEPETPRNENRTRSEESHCDSRSKVYSSVDSKRRSFRFGLDWDMDLLIREPRATIDEVVATNPSGDNIMLDKHSGMSSPVSSPLSRKSQPNIASCRASDVAPDR